MQSLVRRSDPSQRELVLESRARQLRLTCTPSEAALWAALKNNALGVSFKRQVVVGQFIVDLLAPAARLVVEIDGPVHRRRAARDARRDRVLRRMGYRVLRLEAELVLHQLPVALERIGVELREL
jgi:very-short-patch-repair endonuclease